MHEFDELHYQAISDEFNNVRIEAVTNILKREPYVLLTGLTGVGKTTFVETCFNTLLGVRKLYQGESHIHAWANDTSHEMKILFIDESNIGQRQWTEFEGI